MSARAAVQMAKSWIAELDKFDPSQQRDPHGRWTAGGDTVRSTPDAARVNTRRATRSVINALGAAASLANAMDTLGNVYPRGVKDTSAADHLHAARQVHALRAHLQQARAHLRTLRGGEEPEQERRRPSRLSSAFNVGHHALRGVFA
jgi:hypothetical protein